MLKKAGIIVATAAAGLLAVTPFAFADVNTDNQTATCDYTALGTADSSATNTGLVNVLAGVASAGTNAVAQAPIGDCNNVEFEDILDSDSNNNTSTYTRTLNVDSNNKSTP